MRMSQGLSEVSIQMSAVDVAIKMHGVFADSSAAREKHESNLLSPDAVNFSAALQLCIG